jgi:hypothetical protein
LRLLLRFACLSRARFSLPSLIFFRTVFFLVALFYTLL